MTALSVTDLDRRRAQLLARLGELDQRLLAIESELLSHQSKDWDDLAIERENDEVLTSMGDGGRAEIRGIRAALHRLRAGEYGTCTVCGTQISPERLDTLPATPFCRACAP